jgi:N-acetyl-1-D-myo-inositol-2-amino-2-deoxy-alpha-D-glucopyranoside deacetylase
VVRETELREAASVLGVDEADCLRHPDGQLEWVDRDRVAAELAGRIAASHPRVLITFGATGLYHHPDHVAVHGLVLEAIARLPEGPSLYQAAWPPGLVTGLVQDARERGLDTDLWGLDPEDFDAGDEGLTPIDVRPFVGLKLAALRCHRSQLGSGHLLGALPGDLAQAYLGHEHFVPPPGAGWLEDVVVRAGRPSAHG